MHSRTSFLIVAWQKFLHQHQQIFHTILCVSSKCNNSTNNDNNNDLPHNRDLSHFSFYSILIFHAIQKKKCFFLWHLMVFFAVSFLSYSQHNMCTFTYSRKIFLVWSGLLFIALLWFKVFQRISLHFECYQDLTWFLKRVTENSRQNT